MKRLFTTALSILFSFSAFCQGLIMNQEAYDALEKYDPSEEMGFASGNLPTSISYRAYTPSVGDANRFFLRRMGYWLWHAQHDAKYSNEFNS